MKKKLLNFTAVSLLTGALLDPVICSGLEKPVPWGRDFLMVLGGIFCVYMMVKYRNEL